MYLTFAKIILYGLNIIAQQGQVFRVASWSVSEFVLGSKFLDVAMYDN